jgi:hypothetical protein
MYDFLAQAPIDLNGATLGWGAGVLKQLANGLEGLMIGLEQYLVPYIRAYALGFSWFLFVFALIVALWSVASGKGAGPTPLITLLIKVTFVSVLLTGGAGRAGAGLPSAPGEEPKIVTAGGLQRREIAPGDNYTKFAWYTIDFFDALQTSVSNGPLKGIYQARKSLPVCFVQPAPDANLPIDPQNVPAQDGQPAPNAAPNNQSAQVVTKCTRIDTTTGNTSDQVQVAKGDINKKPKSPGEFARDVLVGAIPGVGAAGIVLNFAKDNLPQSVMVLIQILEAPVVAALTITQRILLIVYWAIIGPFAVATIMLTNDYIKRFFSQFIQINLWGIVGQFLVSAIAFLRLGIQVDPTNPSTSWLGVMFTLAVFVCLIFTPKACTFAEGLAASLGGFLVESGLAAVAAASVVGPSAAVKGGADLADRGLADFFISERAGEIWTNSQNQFQRNPSGPIGQEYLSAVAKGQTNQSADDWITSRAQAQAINEAEQAKRQNRNLGVRSGTP